ncbi:MAG TPA: c-type cytochrome [Gammaproteobacteria bacterium]|nr:c-type cytochrome [Gammaproteobacteria bacterium]
MSNQKQILKSGEKILFGIVAVFIGLAVVAYAALEVYRTSRPEPMFANKTHYDFSEEGQVGSALFRKSGCTACHRALRNGTNMGLSLDGVGSVRSLEWLVDFLANPEKTYGAKTFDHGAPPKEAAYVAQLPEKDRHAIAVFISELKSEQGSSSAAMPPEGRSDFIDNMVGAWAPKEWKERYQDIRTKDAPEGASQGRTQSPASKKTSEQANNKAHQE